uniref:Uncharacterized protein n=1 Tax=Onchocerca volvulus TaxID=6282 RepID=A0A8R1TPS8_ONCVO
MIVWWAAFLCSLLMYAKADAKMDSPVQFHDNQLEEFIRILYGSKPLFLVRRSSNERENTGYR